MNNACVWNVAIDVVIVGLFIGVSFVETQSLMKQTLETWPGSRFINVIEIVICSFCRCIWSAFGYIYFVIVLDNISVSISKESKSTENTEVKELKKSSLSPQRLNSLSIADNILARCNLDVIISFNKSSSICFNSSPSIPLSINIF